MKINDNIDNILDERWESVSAQDELTKGLSAYDDRLKKAANIKKELESRRRVYQKAIQLLQQIQIDKARDKEKAVAIHKNKLKRLISDSEIIKNFFKTKSIKNKDEEKIIAMISRKVKEIEKKLHSLKSKLINIKDNRKRLNKELDSILDPIKKAASAITPGTGRTRHKLEENCKITNNSNVDVSQLENIVARFYPYVKQKLKFDKDVKLNLVSDPENAKDAWGKTAYYNPETMEITVFVDNRHPKDMLRSLSHELVHHAQNCRGEFDNTGPVEHGYAQKDPHMRRMEGEAYLLGNGFLVRDFEDHLKSQQNQNLTESKKMKDLTNEQLKTVLENTIKRVAEEMQIPVEESYADVYPAKRDEDVIEEFDDQEMYSRIKADCGKKHKGDLAAIKKCMEAEGMAESLNETSDTEVMQAIDHALGQKFTNYQERGEALEAAIESEQDPARRQHLEKLADQHDDYVAAAHMDLEESLTSKKDRLLFERLTKKWTK